MKYRMLFQNQQMNFAIYDIILISSVVRFWSWFTFYGHTWRQTYLQESSAAFLGYDTAANKLRLDTRKAQKAKDTKRPNGRNR